MPDALTAEQVTAFRAKWSDSPLADRLLGGWLDNAFAHARYEAFVDHYQDDGTVTRRCQHLRALMRTGRRDEALAGVPTLWLVGNSQPPVCDPLFAAWIESRALTQTLVWQRIELALENNQIALARHLTRYLNGTPARRAQAFIAVAQRPELVLQRDRYREDDPQMRAIVSLGLRRTARNDPEAAQNAWRHYEDALAFSATDARAIDQTLTQTLARRGILVDTPDVSVSPGDRHLEAAEAFVVAAIAAEEPARALEVIASLPAENRSQERWVYWQGRAERAAGLLTEKGTADFAALAGRRQYYGFLAASQLGVVPQLNARSLPDDPAVSAAARAAPGMRRVLELYAIGDRTNARREWRFLHTRLDAPVRAAAVAELAATGWTDLAVITTSDPIFADYLALRFPAPHRTAFDAASKANSLPLAYLYGVSRQESAFGAAAVSPVGALGLMQLMPATAELTARRLGMSAPTRGDLLQPAVNVKLGARHLAMLVKRYGGNRFLAAAAYNAGEGRVDRWLAERPLVAADTWIDTIPFLETRNYVKAVMSFGYIYGQLLDAPIPFMTPAELGGPRTAEIARTP